MSRLPAGFELVVDFAEFASGDVERVRELSVTVSIEALRCVVARGIYRPPDLTAVVFVLAHLVARRELKDALAKLLGELPDDELSMRLRPHYVRETARPMPDRLWSALPAFSHNRNASRTWRRSAPCTFHTAPAPRTAHICTCTLHQHPERCTAYVARFIVHPAVARGE